MPTLTIDTQVTPRIITVDAPDTAITIQELVDLLRDWEDTSVQADDDQIISAAGKEPLGGGVTVGITATLQNAQLAFEERVTPLETGTVTTANGSGTTLIDNTATFQTNNVGRGDLVYNTTDGSQCTVISVDSETQLTTTVLVGGTDNDYDISDAYSVYDVVQCDISGGNLVAVDDVGADIDVVFPTFGTQIVRTSSSSATLQELQDIQFASFAGGVWIDTVNGTSGTAFPAGTERQPVDNFTDGLSIASTRGFNRLFVVGDATVDTGLNYTDFVFVGQGKNLSVLTVTAAANVTNCSFIDAEVTGTLDGDSRIEDSVIEDLTFVSGVIERCLLNPGTVTLGGSATAHFIDCASGVPGVSTPIIDCGGSGQALALRNYNGGVELRNKTGSDAVSIDLASGQVVLNSASVTGTGTIVVRGVGKLVDETGAPINTGTWNATVPVINELVEGTNLKHIWQDRGFDADNPVTFDESAKTISVAGTVRTWAGNFIKTLTRTT